MTHWLKVKEYDIEPHPLPVRPKPQVSRADAPCDMPANVLAALDRGTKAVDDLVKLYEIGTAADVVTDEWARGAAIALDLIRARVAETDWNETGGRRFVPVETLPASEGEESGTADAPRRGAPPSAFSPACLQVTTPPNTPAAPDDWEDELKARMGILSGSARRSAYALQVDAEAIVEAWGVNNTVFIALTFGGGGYGPTVAKAQRCFDSFLTHSLGKLFTGGIKVLERGAKYGRVHFHLLADAGADVRTGVDFVALARGDRRSFGPHLRHLLASLRTAGQRYGFGRICECDPIKSTREGIARYVCKYISKHFEQRQPRDKGARLRSYWGTARPRRVVKSCRFSWAGEKGERGWLWRAKLARISALNGMKDSDAWKLRFGSRWAYHIAGYVNAWPLSFYPTKAHAIKDGVKLPKGIPETASDIEINRITSAEVAVLYGKTLCFLVEKD